MTILRQPARAGMAVGAENRVTPPDQRFPACEAATTNC
jgi:hypothetical protein